MLLYIVIYFVSGVIAGSLLNQYACRYCGINYRKNNLAIAVLSGFIFALCGLHAGAGLRLYLLLFFASCLLLIGLIDWQIQIIPDSLVIITAAGGVIYGSQYLTGGLAASVEGGLLGFAVMLGIFIISRGGMGGGDVKLAAALGLWLGMEGVFLFLMLSFAAGGVISALLLWSGLKNRQDAIPFGPFLCVSAFGVLLYMPYLWDYYWYIFNF